MKDRLGSKDIPADTVSVDFYLILHSLHDVYSANCSFSFSSLPEVWKKWKSGGCTGNPLGLLVKTHQTNGSSPHSSGYKAYKEP